MSRLSAVTLACASLLLCAQCAVKRPPKPSWVDSPALPGYYTGVGIAKKTKDRAEDLGRAEEAARTELAQSIESEINSNVQYRIAELALQSESAFESAFYSETSISTSLLIPGIAIADRWYDGKNGLFYCFVKVPIATVDEFQEGNYREVDTFVDKAKSGSAPLNASNVSEYVQSTIQLIDYLQDQYAEQFLGAKHKIKILNQAQELTLDLDRAFAKFTFRSQPISKIAAKIPVYVDVQIQSLYDASPLAHIAYLADFDKGYGSIQQKAVSDADGLLTLKIRQINSIRADNQIRIIPDFYQNMPKSKTSLYPDLPHYLLSIESYDPRKDISIHITSMKGAGFLDVAGAVGDLTDYISRSGYEVRPLESLEALQVYTSIEDISGDLGNLGEGIYVILATKEKERSQPQPGIIAWDTETEWMVLNSSAESEICRSGRVPLRLVERSEFALRQKLRADLYREIRSRIVDVLEECIR